MCEYGFANDRPYIVSINTWCDSPIPRAKRPPLATCAVSACWAIVTGCRGYVGTTAVPSSMRVVTRPTSAANMSASSPNSCVNHAEENPSRSACCTRATCVSKVSPGAVLAPKNNPIRMVPPLSVRDSSYVSPLVPANTTRVIGRVHDNKVAAELPSRSSRDTLFWRVSRDGLCVGAWAGPSLRTGCSAPMDRTTLGTQTS